MLAGRRAVVAMIVVCAGVACSDGRPPDANSDTPPDTASAAAHAAPEAATTKVTLYFTDTEQLRTADCSAVLPTTRVVADSAATPEAVLRLLLRGVTPDERAAGLSSHYEPAPAIGSSRPLIDFFRGLEIARGTAYLDFGAGALAYLNNAACLQGAVKQPMIRTLTDFPDIDRVMFRIDGRVYEDWDA